MKDILKPKIKRLHIELPEAFHNDIKSRSAKRNMTLKKYVQLALYEYMKKDFEEK